MSQRVTLDHPSMGGRIRQDHTTSSKQSRNTSRRTRVDSLVARRAKQARKFHNSSPKTHAQGETDTLDRAVELAQVQVKQLERVQKYSDEYNNPQPRKVSGWKINSIYAMASMLFIFGMFVAISAFVSTTKANEQIEQVQGVLDNGNAAAVSRLADSVPNEDKVSDYDISNYQVGPDEPRYIRIPSIGVSTTRVLHTGLTRDNAVETPEGIYDTSWYNRSAKLIDKLGAMFVVGHYVGPHEAGIFFNLEDLKVGNIVEIEDGDGDLYHFRVIEKEEYSVNDVDMTRALTSVNPDKLGLNLMTCSGTWVASQQQYDHRVLIRTEKL